MQIEEGALVVDHDLVSLRLSSRSFADSEQFHEQFGREVLRLDIAPREDQPLNLEMQLRALPGLAVATAEVSPVFCHHTSAMIDSDDPIIAFVESGTARFRQNGHETIAHAGDLILTTSGLAGTAEHTASRMINWRISRALISPLVSDFDAGIGLLIDKNNPAIPFFLSYLNVLNDHQTLTDAAIRRAVVTHMLDLGALILGARADAAEVAKKRGARAARLRSIKASIVADLARHDLTLARVALRNGISTTYVRKLFEADGTTFTEFVLGERLLRAYQMLTNPKLNDRTIAVIANAAGFNDISYFNRRFRRAYGGSPSEIRYAAYRLDKK
jgi:AraC-like DNA-binding protein